MNTMHMLYVLKVLLKIMSFLNLFNYMSMTEHVKYEDFYAFTIYLECPYLRFIVIIDDSLKLK